MLPWKWFQRQVCTDSWLSCDRCSRSLDHHTGLATISRKCQSLSQMLLDLEHYLCKRSDTGFGWNTVFLDVILRCQADLKKKIDLPSVRTNIHWMPRAKDLWLSGTHLYKTMSDICEESLSQSLVHGCLSKCLHFGNTNPRLWLLGLNTCRLMS